MTRRRTVRTTIGDLMISVVLIALYLVPLRLNKQLNLDPRTLATMIFGCVSLGVFVFYRSLSRWMWAVIAGYLVHPLLVGFFALEMFSFLAKHELLLARYDDLLITALHYETVTIQAMYSLGLLLVFRSVASQINAGNRNLSHEA